MGIGKHAMLIALVKEKTTTKAIGTKIYWYTNCNLYEYTF